LRGAHGGGGSCSSAHGPPSPPQIKPQKNQAAKINIIAERVRRDQPEAASCYRRAGKPFDERIALPAFERDWSDAALC